RLLALGLRPFEEPVVAGMVLHKPLPPVHTSVAVRCADTIDDYLAGFAVLNGVFGERTESRAERHARAERERREHRAGRSARSLGFIDGTLVAAANGVYTPRAVVLGGAGTVERARGRGAYRALVAARYADAIRRGTPTLVVQAGALSRPILARLGFEIVA